MTSLFRATIHGKLTTTLDVYAENHEQATDRAAELCGSRKHVGQVWYVSTCCRREVDVRDLELWTALNR